VDTLAELPFVRPVLSARNRMELSRLRQRLRAHQARPVARPRPAYGVSVHMSLLDEPLVAELHERVEVVMTWPVNDVAALDRVLTYGVTGVVSDELDVLSELIRRQA
jgi:hypothetical protein